MSAFKRIADVVHKSVVTGIFGGFLYVTLSVGVQVIEGKQVTKGEQIQAGFIQMMKDRASEEYSKYYKTDHREWYDKDDDSYLKKLPKKEDYAAAAPKSN